MTKILDINGVNTLWEKVKSLIPISNGNLTNDAGYQTADEVNYAIIDKGYATQEYIDNRASCVYNFKGTCISSELPTEGNISGDTYCLTDESEYGEIGTHVAWTVDGAWAILPGLLCTSIVQYDAMEVGM